MSINIGPASDDDLRPKIMVVGVGGAGGNAIANMMEAKIEGVDFIVANTDAQALSTSPSEKRIQLGPDITGGLGAGARPEVGKAAAEELSRAVKRVIKNGDPGHVPLAEVCVERARAIKGMFKFGYFGHVPVLQTDPNKCFCVMIRRVPVSRARTKVCTMYSVECQVYD